MALLHGARVCGVGCGHKVAKISEHQRGAGVSKEVTMLEAPTLALAECDKSTDAPSKVEAAWESRICL